MTLVTRATKGAALTHAEMDGNLTTLDLNGYVILEAEFMALAAANRDKFGGSGVVEFGKTFVNYPSINSGLSQVGAPNPTLADRLWMGRTGTSPVGDSKTGYPVINVNGVESVLHTTDQPIDGANRNVQIDFPPAPIATNLVTNGTFETDIVGWNSLNEATVAWESGSMRATSSAASNALVRYTLPVSIPSGTKIRLRIKSEQVVGSNGSIRLNGTYDIDIAFSATDGYDQYDIELTSDLVYIDLFGSGVSTGALFDDVSIIDFGKVERQDLVFLETWHEKVSDKDFVYPLGAVATLLPTDPSTGLTTVNGSFSGYSTYSLFGNWQTNSALIGKGLVWSTMTDANKKKFISDPANNIYLAEDGELVQVRYRIRVIEGLGADWFSFPGDPVNIAMYNVDARTLAQGQLAVGVDLGASSHPNGYFAPANGIYSPHRGKGLSVVGSNDVEIAYKGLCFAMPICLVSRRNQGAYHSVFNPNGSRTFFNRTSTTNNSYDWYMTNAKKPNSTFDCFQLGADGTNVIGDVAPFARGFSGSISAGTSGREDGCYYDAIYEGDVKDLRNSAHKPLDLNRTREKALNELIGGTKRGWEKGARISTDGTVGGTSAALSGMQSKNLLHCDLIGDPANYYRGSYDFLSSDGVQTVAKGDVIKVVSGYTGNTDPSGPATVGNYYKLILDGPYTLDVNTLSISAPSGFIDLGSDRADSWITNGIAANPLLVGGNGEDLIPDGTSKTFKMSRKNNDSSVLLALYSSDNGVTWGDNTVGINGLFNSTTNSYTLNTPAGWLYMIFYLTEASPFEVADNAEVLSLGNVWAGNSNLVTNGSLLVDHIIGKIPVGSYYGIVSVNYSLDGLSLSTRTGARQPNHDNTAVELDSVSGPAVKVLDYLTRENGKLYLQCLFKGMKFDVDWGDDSKFNVVDGISTTTDDNGNTVVIGQKRVELPIFIGDAE